MTFSEIVFRIDRANDPDLDIPDAVVSLWCNNRDRDVLEIRTDEPLGRELQNRITQKTGVVMHTVDPDGRTAVIVRECRCYERGSVPELLAKTNCLLMPPMVYQSGWEHYKIVAFKPALEQRLFKLLENLGKTEILSKARVVNTGTGGALRISIMSLFSRLTDKQLRALLTAYSMGYYKSPRNTTTEELARMLKVTRPTYEEHLRKSENKIISSIAPYFNLLYRRRSNVVSTRQQLELLQ